jgi:beta-1,4-N-acetylglucosaminyltransferase
VITLKKLKICIVSSCGGHLTEVRQLAPAYHLHDTFYVLNDKIILPSDMEGRTYFIHHSERDWLLILNFFEAFRVLWRERPGVILSTGAGPVVPFALIGKLFKVRTIYIETITRISSPSLTGRIMYWLSYKFYYQSEGLKIYFPKGIYGGPLI